MDKVIDKIAALGVPGLVLVVAMAVSTFKCELVRFRPSRH